MKKQIAILPGDGIGKEIISSAITVLNEIANLFDHDFSYEYARIGGEAIDIDGTPLPEETIKVCKESDAILLGAVGGPKWDNNPPDLRPEKGLLGIRKSLQLFANLRPVIAFDSLSDASTLKPSVLNGTDLMIVRELTGGIYFGQPSERRKAKSGEEIAVDTLYYSREEIERIVRKGFELAALRRRKLTSVDKANVLESSRMWREIVDEIAHEYPGVEVSHMLVDNAAMQLIRNPKQFDVIVTENMFGDILSDEAAMLTGSLGMLSSASLSANGPGLYEPAHGSAPDIAGQNKANPLATLLSVAMMLKYSFGMNNEGSLIEKSIECVLEEGYRTADLADHSELILSTDEMTNKVIETITILHKSTKMSAN
ncbi:3-isopropylmalate dehydrogenase [Bacillus solimangrovi]|uniref:3-isopropylmalate dehydrogenase n=1 Tax=Bacillus solimangrovi TaxID=1305675 RepID=A0A1E5LBG7_9BACI|nr:3-isopropylmalate dehydrogenase [Bacillus solimangrovi]OEH91424.1 3-isopropylmalate dehydrogenase [Bacillus solimangrovi]